MYIDAAQIQKDGNRIYVSERGKDGQRIIKSQMPPYVLYYTDPDGNFTSIYGDKLKRVHNTSRRAHENDLQYYRDRGCNIFESDVKPVFRVLEEKYGHLDDLPSLNVGIIDIEADKDPKKGFTRVRDPYAIINALTIYKKHLDTYITLIVPPPNLTVAQTESILANTGHQAEDGSYVEGPGRDEFSDLTEEHGYFVCEDEADLLLTFLELIEDIDVLTGWNSTFFDIPYLIQRMRIVLGGESINKLAMEDGTDQHPYDPTSESVTHIQRMNLFPTVPKQRHVERFGTFETVYDLCGRVHLDYLELYQKFPHEELHSYTLDFVLKHEVKQSKVVYEGSLDQLYRLNIRRFAAYNRQDVAGLKALDAKKKYIDLANVMAHMASVTLREVLGSVVIIEQAILKRLHKDKLICFDKMEKQHDLPIPGAFVVNPEKGDYRCVASYDFNSLYPTTIRLVNISPEQIIGQFDLNRTITKWRKHFVDYGGDTGRKDAGTKAWSHFTGVLEYHDVIDETEEQLTLVFEGTGEEITLTGKEWKEVLKENNWSISGFGTVFDLSREGIVTKCMTEWYADRVKLQDQKKKYGKAQEGVNDPDRLKELKELEAYYDMLQQAKKLFLNSTYGAYLNSYFRFNDPRLGASVTLSGRVMTKHMVKQTSYVMTGVYDFDRRAIIYGDTDSCYATMHWYMQQNGIEITDRNMVKLADELGEKINASMPPFLEGAFLIDQKRGEILEAGREIVGRRGLFKDKKKRYALHIIDKEGKTVDDLKIVGMETRRSDTPKHIQEFLIQCLTQTIKENKSYAEIRQIVDEFRAGFRKLDPWRIGSPGRVKKLATATKKHNVYNSRTEDGVVGLAKPNSHFYVKAALNTNTLMTHYNETRWDVIRDGDKVEVLYLSPNEFDMDVVGIRTGETYVPEWFKTLPVDRARMEQKLIDQKLHNVLGDVLEWDFTPQTNYASEVFEENTDFYSMAG